MCNDTNKKKNAKVKVCENERKKKYDAKKKTLKAKENIGV